LFHRFFSFVFLTIDTTDQNELLIFFAEEKNRERKIMAVVSLLDFNFNCDASHLISTWSNNHVLMWNTRTGRAEVDEDGLALPFGARRDNRLRRRCTTKTTEKKTTSTIATASLVMDQPHLVTMIGHSNIVLVTGGSRDAHEWKNNEISIVRCDAFDLRDFERGGYCESETKQEAKKKEVVVVKKQRMEAGCCIGKIRFQKFRPVLRMLTCSSNSWLVVVTHERVIIYSLPTFTLLHQYETLYNSRGLACLVQGSVIIDDNITHEDDSDPSDGSATAAAAGGAVHKKPTATAVLHMTQQAAIFPATTPFTLRVISSSSKRVSVCDDSFIIDVSAGLKRKSSIHVACEYVDQVSDGIACVDLHSNMHLLCVALADGRRIDVYNLDIERKNAFLIQTYSRGSATARIFNLSWHPVEFCFLCTSDRGTVHIFEVESRAVRTTRSGKATTARSLVSMVTGVDLGVKTSTGRFTIPDVYHPRSGDGGVILAAFSHHDKKKMTQNLQEGKIEFLVACSSGTCLRAVYQRKSGSSSSSGKCTMIDSFSLLPPPDDDTID
jgi:WD40 repeat protein